MWDEGLDPRSQHSPFCRETAGHRWFPDQVKKSTGSGAAVAFLLWVQEVGSSNLPSPTGGTPSTAREDARSGDDPAEFLAQFAEELDLAGRQHGPRCRRQLVGDALDALAMCSPRIGERSIGVEPSSSLEAISRREPVVVTPASRALQHRGWDGARDHAMGRLRAREVGRGKRRGARREEGAWTLELDGGERVRARALVNAAGPWVADVLGHVLRANAPAKVRLVKGSHIVVPKSKFCVPVPTVTLMR